MSNLLTSTRNKKTVDYRMLNTESPILSENKSLGAVTLVDIPQTDGMLARF